MRAFGSHGFIRTLQCFCINKLLDLLGQYRLLASGRAIMLKDQNVVGPVDSVFCASGRAKMLRGPDVLKPAQHWDLLVFWAHQRSPLFALISVLFVGF